MTLPQFVRRSAVRRYIAASDLGYQPCGQQVFSLLAGRRGFRAVSGKRGDRPGHDHHFLRLAAWARRDSAKAEARVMEPTLVESLECPPAS
jgi:hypothetical protein